MPLQQIGSNDEDGATFGSAASKLVGFHGSKCDQAAAITSISTSAALCVCGVFAFTSAQANGLITAVNAIIAALNEKGLTA
jgi:hypothetical protein